MDTARTSADRGHDAEGARGAGAGDAAGTGAHADDARRVTVLQEWECLVEELGQGTVYARLADVTCPSHEDEWCEIPLADFHADLVAEMEFGTIFRMLVVQDAALETSLVLAPLVGPWVPDDTGARLAELLGHFATRAGPEDKAWMAGCRTGEDEGP